MFKLLIASLLVALAALLSGCATSNYTYGRDFDSANVQAITKGKTTSAELVALFGQPFMKSVVSGTEEKWTYLYNSGTAKAQSYIVSMKVETTGQQKMLDVLVKDGVVSNYTFTEGASPYSSYTSNTQTAK